jgi:NTE family protein
VTPRRVGLVLGGGGLTGTAFHAGVLAGLTEAVGWDARDAAIIVGTSAGSTSSILLRAGLPPTDLVARMTGEAPSPEGRHILDGLGALRRPRPIGPRARRPASPALLAAMARRPWAFRPEHLAAAALPAGTFDIMDSIAGFGTLFETWPSAPTWLCTVRLDDGARVVFGRDAAASVRDAVSASCAIPGYYAPVQIDGKRYVDGGVWSMHSADLLADEALDAVVVSAPLATADPRALDRGNVLRVPIRRRLDRELAALRRAGVPVLVLAPDARVRAVMGTASMRIERRAPVAVATRAHVRALADAGRLGPLVPG